jgi:Mg-chelatase subunit ChlD
MANFMNALDNHTSNQTGEKGHAEYSWSNSIREKIVQFGFQLTRTDEKGTQKLSFVLNELLSSLKGQYDNNFNNNSRKEVIKEYLILLYKMIAQTRDIVDGKGECSLTYMMIHVWHEYYPELACYAVNCLVDLGEDTHQYGSWKDIKYLCNYVHKQNCEIDHPLIQYAINLINIQIKTDFANIETDKISLAGKWVPREKSNRFGWIYSVLACQYFPAYIFSAKFANEDNRKRSQANAILKCKTEYRKILSALNKKIDTLQIKQCGKNWTDINFKKVTSVSLSKQKKAFLNVTKKDLPRFPDDVDRTECAEHFNEHIQKAVKGEVEMKGKRIGLNDFTKQAFEINTGYLSSTIQAEKDLLNSQWRDNSSQNGQLENMIAMVDTSGSMTGDPLHAAIALGIRVAEKSKLGKRVITFSSIPKWVNLEGQNDFCSMVKTLQQSEWGMSTNFDAALNMILDAIISAKLEPEDVAGLTLVIFSDMQMDQADNSYSGQKSTVLYDKIKMKYAEAGIRVKGKPYNPPHILFWNLRSTTGFPVLSTQTNASMLSGFSPAMLNLFCEQGIDALQSCSPWSIFVKSLENDRYLIMENKAREVFQ